MHSLIVRIPSFRYEDSAMEKGYTVFKIEVLTSGRQHSIEKRYSEFHSLHKKLKKFIKAPDLPSKHVRNWVPKVLEHRRLGLEIYLQTIIMENEVENGTVLIIHTNLCLFRSFDETESEESSKLSHQPVLLFLRDPYVLPAADGNEMLSSFISSLLVPPFTN
ncbi:SNX24 protein, partial [Polyodon spathula]|nr:SNX24 protein [Polyodon spathula]